MLEIKLELGKKVSTIAKISLLSLLVRQHEKKGMVGGKNKIARLVIINQLIMMVS